MSHLVKLKKGGKAIVVAVFAAAFAMLAVLVLVGCNVTPSLQDSGSSSSDSGFSGSTSTDSLSASGSSRKTTAIASDDLFRSKLQEYVGQYGVPTTLTTTNTKAVGGLSFAHVADFGFGDCLVTAHPTGEAANLKYTLEVWACYDSGEGLERIYQAPVTGAISLGNYNGHTAIITLGDGSSVEDANKDDNVQQYQVVALAGDGSLKVAEDIVRIVQAQRDPSTGNRLPDKYLINGKEVSAEEWNAAMDCRKQGAKSYGLVAYDINGVREGSDGEGISATIDETNRTLEHFGAGLPVSQANGAAAEGTKDGYYRSTLLQSASESNRSKAIVRIARIEGGYVRFSGSMEYWPQRSLVADVTPSTIVGPQEWSVKLSSNVEYRLYGGSGGPISSTREEFDGHLGSADKLNFAFEVANGEVISVELHS